MTTARIITGDCPEVMRGMADNSVDAVVTDIPYGGVNYCTGGIRLLDKGAANKLTFSVPEFAPEILRLARGSLYVFCSIQQLADVERLCGELTTRRIVWEKTNPMPLNGQYVWLSGVELCFFARKAKATFNGRCRNTVLRYPSGWSNRHPTEQPVALMGELIAASTNEGDVVCDPCCGSGTTGVACAQLGRTFIGIEIDPTYAELARKRIREECGLLCEVTS